MPAFTPHEKDLIAQCVASLADVCDRANTRDGCGFSKSTAAPGHELAAFGRERWSAELWTYAGRLAAHHSRQLEAAGRLEADAAEQLRHVASGSIKAPVIPSNWVDLCEDDHDFLAVSRAFDSTMVAVLSRLPEDDVYRPAGGGKLWRIGERFAFILEDVIDQLDVLDGRVYRMVETSAAQASDFDRALTHRGPLVEMREDGFYSFVWEFNSALYADIKELGAGMIIKGKTWNDVTHILDPNLSDAVFDRGRAHGIDFRFMPEQIPAAKEGPKL